MANGPLLSSTYKKKIQQSAIRPMGPTLPVSRKKYNPITGKMETEVRQERFKGGGKTKYRHSNGLKQHN